MTKAPTFTNLEIAEVKGGVIAVGDTVRFTHMENLVHYGTVMAITHRSSDDSVTVLVKSLSDTGFDGTLRGHHKALVPAQDCLVNAKMKTRFLPR